jgi:prefoldin subunit 5
MVAAMKLSEVLLGLKDELAGIRSQMGELRDSIYEHSKAEDTREQRRTQEEIAREDRVRTENKRHYDVQNSIRWATWCAFGAAVIYAGIAAFTYSQISKQYPELKKSADAAKEAADQISKQYPELQKSADAAKSAADAAYASIRPWIKIENVELVQATGPIKTLMFHWPLTGKTVPPMIQIKASLVNVGHSVAQDAEVSGELFFGRFASDKWYDVVTREQKRFCGSMANRTPSSASQIVFPSDRWESNMGIGGIVHEADIMRTPGSSLTHSAASLILCVNYRGITSDRFQSQARVSVFEDKAILIELGTDTDATRLSLVREPNGDHAN